MSDKKSESNFFVRLGLHNLLKFNWYGSDYKIELDAKDDKS